MKPIRRVVNAYVIPILALDKAGNYKVVAQEYTTNKHLAKKYAARTHKVCMEMSIDDLMRYAKDNGKLWEITEEEYQDQVTMDEIMNEKEKEYNE